MQITDDPTRPRSTLNNVEVFNVRWLNANGRKNGATKSTKAAAFALAKRAQERGGTEVQILRQWCGGWLF